MTGPLGAAYLRPNHADRMISVASGTGFAPMWSIAVAAIFERPERELVFVVAARTLKSLYMHQGLCRLGRPWLHRTAFRKICRLAREGGDVAGPVWFQQ